MSSASSVAGGLDSASTSGDEAVDLGALDGAQGGAPGAAQEGGRGGVPAVGPTAASDSSFTPYVFDRSPGWVLLPAFALLLVAVHLLRLRPAGHRSEVRPQPGAELSPLSQFNQKSLPPSSSSGGGGA